MSKSKVKLLCFFRKMIQKGYVLACILAILFASIGSSQASVTDTLGSEAVVTNTSIIDKSWQLNSSGAALSAIVNLSTIPVNITATGVINSTNDDNAIYASVLANNSTLTNDIALVSVSGAISGLASVNIQQNSAITAFSQVSNSSVTTNIINPFGGSSVSVSGNSISAETGLNETSQTAQGKLNDAFNSSISGTALLQPANPQLSGDAGLFVGSFQHNNVISSTVMGNPFADISGTNSIAQTITGTLGSSLSLNTDNNSISAAFTGNNAANLLALETGGATSLTSSAGIANLQINSNYDWPTYVSNTSAIIEAGSSISASVQTNPLISSTLSFDGNQIKASATGSVSKNELQIAAGLNVAADGAQTNSLNFTAGFETATTSGGLFLNNMQLSAIAPISASATDPAGAAAALSVDSRGLISSALTADGNSFEAIALGNDAYGSISVGGATSFNSAVAASNLQTVNLSPVTATAASGTLAVNLGGSPNVVNDPTENTTGSTINVNNNTISALAVANRDPLLVSITGTTVTDGLTQIAGTSVNNATSSLASTSGISAISSQFATGSNVTASNLGAGVNLLLAGYPDASGVVGPYVTNSTLTQSGNSLASLANINEGLVAVGITANGLNASSSVASIQNATNSNVLANTSGKIVTGVNTRDTVNNSNLAVLVGDGNLSDGIFAGNSISSTAGGNLNASALDATVATTMQATNVIDKNGLTSNVIGLSSAAATNQALAEMSVLTDQRLSANTITATTDYSQIVGIIRPSSYLLSNSTLNVDGNQVTATARGNLTSNSLDFSALYVDMTAAESTGSPAGTNLASMGAVQVIGAGSAITANINAGAGNTGTTVTTNEILGMIAGNGPMTNIALSVDNNSVTAAATGTNAINSLNGSGGKLAQDAPSALSGILHIGADPTTALTISDTAAANAIVQDNAGNVAANLANSQQYQITSLVKASISDRTATNTTISADNNTAVALATGSSADASTALAFNTQETSAATVVQQAQRGSTIATVGSNGGVQISAFTDAEMYNPTTISPWQVNLISSTISASGNTAGAQAIGATATSSLTAGGAKTETLASGYGDTPWTGNIITDGASATIVSPGGATGATNSSADYMLGVQQYVSGVTTASANDLSVFAAGGSFAGGSVKADSNFLTAQATGGTSTTGLSLKANDMTASGNAENTVDAVLSSDQRLSAAVSASLTNSDVTAKALNLTTAATGTNKAEAISASNNTLLAKGTGLTSTNALATNATTSVAGDGSEARYTDVSSDLIANGWDRLILSNQNISSAVTVTATANSVAAAVTGSPTPLTSSTLPGDINGDTLTVDANSIFAQGTGASSSNILSTSAGTSLASLSQAIIANQASDAAVRVTNASASATITLGGSNILGNSTNSSLSLSENNLGAAANGLNGANTITMSAPASIMDNGLLPATNLIMSEQDLADTATASATLTDSLVRLFVPNAVIGSSLKVDNNIQEASAKGATSSNTMSAESGSLGTTGTEGIGLAVVANQNSAAPVSATNSGAGTYLTIGGAASGDSLVLSGNSIGASASNLTGANSMTVKAVTANIGDTSTLSYLTGPTASADRSILSTQNVANTGDVSATVTDPTMSLSVAGGLSGNSTAYLSSNTIASAATIAANTNTLTNSASTLLTSSALIGSVQNSAADSTALTDLTNGGLFINIGTGTSDATVALADNQVTASATGLTATNTLNVTAGSMQGAIPPVLGSITASAPLGVINHNMNSALSAISSEQTTSGAISAEVLSPYLGIDLDVGVTNSAVHADSNLVQASSTAASATNTLMQLADTSMADAPALLAASQVISGSSTATVTDAWIWSHIDGNVNASNMTANNNTIQAVATGGAMKNYLDPGAGTSITAQINEPDPAVATASSNFIGSYGLVSRQTSTAPVTATVDAEPWVELAVYGNIDNNSAVSASGNIIRAQAANLTTDNSIVTAAATALSGVTSGVLSYQNVAAATSASVTGAQVQLTGGDLTGAANADSNWLVAIATGGDVTNDLKVTGLSVSGMPAGAVTSLATSNLSLAATSGADSMNSVLNVQSRTGNVTATLDADDNGQGILAAFAAVTGSVSVNNNILAAEASGLVAKNTLALASKTLIDGGSTALGSVQSSTADITASVTGVDSSTGVSFTATGALTGTAKVDANTILADATNNLAINSLTATASTQMINLGNSTTTTITAPLTDISAGTAGLVLQNLQQGTGAVTASIVTTDVNTAITSVIVGPLNGTATVDNNTMLAQARGQVAQNSLVLNAGTALNASASLANLQTNGGPISSTITNGDISLTASNVTGTTSVSGNKVQASSTANLALNSMDIAGTLAASTGGSAGSLTATADYVALNTQSNTAAVASSVSNYTIRLADSASTTGTASVLNNSILANATGNSSTNTFTISPKASSNTADFAFTGYQSNTGAISSSISGASISLASTGGTGTFSATGNKIGATSIGNSSISSIKSGN